MSEVHPTVATRGWDPSLPYNGLPDLPPTADIESRPVLKACITARAALAEMDGACKLIPNPTVLINSIPLLEAQASSEIENIVTTSDSLFRYAQAEDQAVDPATKEAFRYRAALRQGFERLRDRPVNVRTAIEVCSTIKGIRMEVRRVPGTTVSNSATGEVIYTPPVGESLLKAKLANWATFVHEARNVDPLIRMAVAHYQFEAIHPFSDGNGRTGRVLNLLHLVEENLLHQPVLYLSRYILRHRSDYYRLLHGVTAKGDWEAWILYMLSAVTETTTWTTKKIEAVRHLQTITLEHLRLSLPAIYSHELVEIIFTQPYSRIGNLVSAGIAQRETASEYLKLLAQIGILKELKLGREKLFIHTKLLHLLTQDGNDVTAYKPSSKVRAPRTPRARQA